MVPPKPDTAATLAPPVPLPRQWWRLALRRFGLWLWRLGGGTASGDGGEADLLALQRSEQHLRMAEQLANLGSFDWNLRTGERYWSDQHYTIWGVRKGADMPSFELFLSGIHPDDLPHVFDRYFQSSRPDKPVEGGTGIGRQQLEIALERDLCSLKRRDHGGTVTIQCFLHLTDRHGHALRPLLEGPEEKEFVLWAAKGIRLEAVHTGMDGCSGCTQLCTKDL